MNHDVERQGSFAPSRAAAECDTKSSSSRAGTAQPVSAALSRTTFPNFNQSPRMLAQRRALTSCFGAAIAFPGEKQNESAVPPVAASPVQRATAEKNNDVPVNATGLPNSLKTGIESLSGFAMSHVHVHRNSSKPTQLNALAYTQGSEIHLGPGQERHLPHEAWHVVQQAQGRVRPTLQTKDGISVNDDAGLEHEADVMGGRALSATSQLKHESIQRDGPSDRGTFAAASTAPAQRVLNVNEVPWVHNSEITSLDENFTYNTEHGFKEFVNRKFPDRTPYPEQFWQTPIMVKYLALVTQESPQTVRFAEIANAVAAAAGELRGVAERLSTLDSSGSVPQHHEFLRFGEQPQERLRGHSAGPVGYASKMMGKSGEHDDFSQLLQNVDTVVLTTGKIETLPASGTKWEPIEIRRPQDKAERRPGLSIINYSEQIYRANSQTELAVCGVRGTVLMVQFGLAIREFAHAILGKTIQIQTISSSDAVQENYSRLLGFFTKNSRFQGAHTVVFGYASAFTGGPKFRLLDEQQDHGWVGFLFEHDTKGKFAVFDSDLTHSYHGEILAQNVKLLLQDQVGHNVQKVLIGGSAGSLLAPGSGSEDSSSGLGSDEESLVPNEIFIPEGILRPDGYFKKNALFGVNLPGQRVSLPGSMHTSVVSVLAETPGVLDDLFEFGIKTVDMEFAYVAMVLGDLQKPPSDERDLAEVALGVACLVTDFPKTGAHGVALAEKNESAKKATKDRFVETVIAAL